MKQFIIVLCFILILIMSGGCVEKRKAQERKKLDITVCTREQIPKEILILMKKKKKKPVQFIYSLQEYMYIIIGYGKQKGGGYSIRLDECSQDATSIYVHTTLLGSKEEKNQWSSYPYIVIKCMKSDKNVIFL